jgi:hypothetical protein
MSKVFLIITLASIPLCWADMEHRPLQGEKPSNERLSLSRGCFQEIRLLGCGHPREDQVFFKTCLQEQQNSLTPVCFNFFHRLYVPRKLHSSD